MTFWERYEQLCLDAGYKPGSEQAAQIIGSNRGTISAWKTSGKPPKPEYLMMIADAYGVSTDYLLCRTDNPTDYTLTDNSNTAITSPGNGANGATPNIMLLYDQLDDIDKGKVEGYAQGLLAQDKYTQCENTNIMKKHA